MFTGIIEGTGRIKTFKKGDDSAQIEIESRFKLEELAIGDSISINGCCLTVTSRLGNTFWADISHETLEKTGLSNAKPEDLVNLERPLKIGSRLGGHFVQGHIDGIGSITTISQREGATEFEIEIPPHLGRYVIDKGSITIDGVSLTANECEGNIVKVCIIPHTKTTTRFSDYDIGSLVNVEVDMLAKYIEKIGFLDSEEAKEEGVNYEFEDSTD